jgi:carbon-monoxide dehydrogenase small subunit
MTGTFTIEVTINGRLRSLEIAPNQTLLDALRDTAELTGTKECCVVGECGACTVIVDGRPMNSCLMLAVEVDGANVTTVEGLETEDGLSPVQGAFLDESAAQCGFCIPGQLMSATALLQRNPDPSVEEVQEALAGNLCRCAGYEQITKAVMAAAKEVKQ